MTCPQCRQETTPGAAFCDECGARLEARCASCGETSPPEIARARERFGAALDLFERVGARRHAEEVRRLAAASAAGGC
jgi:predicted amidophosphoribosyltransferase